MNERKGVKVVFSGPSQVTLFAEAVAWLEANPSLLVVRCLFGLDEDELFKLTLTARPADSSVVKG